MKITCPACNAKYSLPDERVQGKNKVFKIPCKRCGAEIRVRGLETAEEVGRTTLPFALDLPPQQAAAPVPIWFAGIDGKQVGPMTEAEVVEHITAGRLGAADLVWRKGFTAWTPVKDVAPFDDMVSAAPGVPTPDPAATKKSPRRAQTLELSAAMIELLVKLDGQQGSEPELPPDLGTVEPPNLPPLEPEPTVVAARPTPAKTQAPRVAGDAKAAAALDDVETAVSPVPPRPVDSQPAVRTSEPVAAAAKPAESRAASAKRDSAPAPAAQAAARADLPLPAEASHGEPALPEPSVKIRLPEDKIRTPDATDNRGRTGDARSTGTAAGKEAGKVDIKPVLPAARTESKPGKVEAKTEAKPAAKTAATPAGKGAPVTTGTGKAVVAAAKSGPPMGLIAGGGVAVVGIIAAVIAMSGKPADKPVIPEPAAVTADVAPSVPAVDAQAAAPAPAPDVAAAAPEADVVAAAAQPDVVVAAEDVQAAKIEAAKIEEGKADEKTAEAKKAEEAKADEAKKAEEAKAAEAKKAEEAKKADDAKAAEAKKAEDAKAAEAKKAEDKKNADEAKKAAAEAKKAADEAKKLAAEDAKQKKAEADAKRKADAEAASEKKKAAAEEAARKKEEAAAAKKAAAEEAKRKKEEEAARKKAEADAKVAAAEAGKTKKPTVSDEDLD
ncbi:MAG: zinc-ribbon domain-containing protein, partial [Deltaproteobacteria bacterium]|nr:zinc-ribbon domain-containing protein [Deltaproteobacteria bacterium]